MSVIGTENTSIRNGPYARSGSGSNAEVFVKKGGSGAAGDRGPSFTVDLSDRAKALLSKAEQGRALAGQLAAHMQAGSAALFRDGQLSKLPALDEGQRSQPSEEERDVHGAASSLQGLYDGMPKTLDQALADHRKVVLEAYPDEIGRMKSGLASGALKAEDGWNEIISSREAELAAAKQGTMRIQAVNDPNLIQTENEFTVTRDIGGWSARGVTVNANFPALQDSFGTKNLRPGSSPWTGDYVIRW
ncbi:hypothetical protein J2847_005620 [Azospirillum agricola]|uniref:hypothetical protein n=1 Tax=Azospirillum agricola TaxID=1720247 RepID=UPI001AE4FA7E|nr:hypothetical protein [Azospirillum agricola]MBP2232295.1 hypothetical protein [Azospirillum agricola]